MPRNKNLYDLKKRRGLTPDQIRMLSGMTPGRKAAMSKHAKAKLRPVAHNTVMIKNMKQGVSLEKSHIRALREVDFKKHRPNSFQRATMGVIK